MKFFKNFLLLFLLSFTTMAQVQFEAKVSKNKLGLNERLRIDFEMNENGDNFVPPRFSNFNVVGGPSQSVSNSWVNGVRSFSKTYSYYLTPKSKGTFTIQQATIEIENEVYKTSPLKVVVTDAIEIPKNPNDPNYIASKNIHLVAEVSKSSPYLNEAVTVVYKLYVSNTVSVSNWQELSTPRYNDFWSQNIDVKGVNVESGMYKGESYRYVVLRKVVLFPQKSGKLELEPLSLDISIDVPSNRRDFFGSRIMTQVHRTISAGKRVLNVKALPQNKPAGFTGAVGDFKFDVSISKEELNASESLTARVNVFGKGNLKLFSLPKLKLPSSLEVYEPEHNERVSVSLGGMTGKIEDSYTIIPQFQGKYPINDFHFSYFNPKTEKYVTLNSKDLLIKVNNGPINSRTETGVTSIEGTNQVVQKHQISNSSDQFKFIKTTTNLVPVGSDYLFGTKLFWFLIVIPLVLLLILLIFDKILQKRNSDVTGLKVRTANRLAKKYLSEAKKNSSNKELFYESLERAIFNFLKAKLQIEQTEYNRDQLSEMLISKSIKEDVIKDLLSVLETCNFARFTPSTPDSINKDYQKAEDILSQITNSI